MTDINEHVDVVNIDCTTGEVTKRSYTAEELAQREIDMAAAAIERAEIEAQVAARAAAKASAEAKLAALGLTAEEIAAL